MEKTMKKLTRDEVIEIIGGGYWCTEMVNGEVVTLGVESTIKSISQFPKLVPSASFGRSWMLTRFLMFVAFVSRFFVFLRLYFILCRQREENSPLSSARIMA